MDEPVYPFNAEPLEFYYRFESVSAEKTVYKLVVIRETSLPTVFNLALLDELESGELSDATVSNNQDMPTVLATVFRITANFLDKFPDKIIAFEGSDNRRTRLYRIALARELPKLQQRFNIVGQIGNDLEPFIPNRPYECFFISLK